MKNLMQMLRDNAGAERKPLNVVRAEGSTEATLYVYDVIDAYWGVNAQDMAKAISGMDASRRCICGSTRQAATSSRRAPSPTQFASSRDRRLRTSTALLPL